MASRPRHAALPTPGQRALRASLAAAVSLVSVLGVTATAAVADAPNHGTVKIDEETLGTDDGPSNNPKPLGCTFAIDFYNFPGDEATALVSFENKSPGKGTYDPVSETDLQGERTVVFPTLEGPASVLEHHQKTYTVNPNGGLTALPNGDIMLKVTVELAGDSNFNKHKVFKLECLPVLPQPPLPAPVPDLAITKGGWDTATVGTDGSYTLAVSNVGPLAVTDPIVVTDTLPAGVTPIEATGEGFDCTIADQLVTCTRDADLAPDDTTDAITVAVTFGADAVPSVVNTAAVAAVTGETNLDNNVDTHTTTVTPLTPPTSFDLAVDKTGPATAATDASIAYVINVVSSGPDASPAYVLTDQLTPGQIATAVSAGPDYACEISANQRTVTCTRSAALASGTSASPVTVTVTVRAGAGSSIANTASVPVLTGDTNVDNNRDTVTTTVPTPLRDVVQIPGQDPIQDPIQNPGHNPVQTPVFVGPPTGLEPEAPELPGVLGNSLDQPAMLPTQPAPVEKAPVPLAPAPGLPRPAVVTSQGAAVAAAAVQPRALPFTGSSIDNLLGTGLALLLLGAGALLAGARAPRSAAV